MPHHRSVRPWTSVAVVATLGALLLAACGPDGGGTTPPPTDGVAITVTVIGSGRVVAPSIDLDCSSTCTVFVADGAAVSLAAQPTGGQVFAAWDGPCSLFDDACTWRVDGDVEVTATFAPHVLRFALEGDGEGRFRISTGDDTFFCQVACFTTLDQPLSVAITHQVDSPTRTTFDGWEGPCTVRSNDPPDCLALVSGRTTVGMTWRHAPIASSHTHSTDEGTTLTVDAPDGVLDGVDDTEGDTHVASRTAGPENGALQLAADGSFTYTPNGGFSGLDFFSYRATDAFGNPSNQAEVTIVVRPRLTLTKVGGGTVTSVPAGIECGPSCTSASLVVDAGTLVMLTAFEPDGIDFVEWSGASCAGSTLLVCEVTVTEATAVTATFDASPFTVSVATDGNGVGTVTSTPTGIDTGIDQTSADFPPGTTVTLTAAAATGSTFTAWGAGACEASTNPVCVIDEIGADTSATAIFTLDDVTLTVTTNGDGTVTSTPTGIDTGSDQTSADFAPGTTVTLTATPGSGQVVAAWVGQPCEGEPTTVCTFALDGDATIVVEFGPEE